MSRATNVSLSVSFHSDNVDLDDRQPILQAIRNNIEEQKLWPDLGIRIGYQSCTAWNNGKITLLFVLQSRLGKQSGIDIRELGLPTQITMVYVEAIDVELTLTSGLKDSRSSSMLARHGIFVEHRCDVAERLSVNNACRPLISESLRFFFDPVPVPKARYIRPRLFIAPRLSDLAPGVFVSDYIHAIHTRQKTLGSLVKILADFKPQEDFVTARSVQSSQQHYPTTISRVLEEKVWWNMINILRWSRTPSKNTDIAFTKHVVNKNESDTPCLKVPSEDLLGYGTSDNAGQEINLISSVSQNEIVETKDSIESSTTTSVEFAPKQTCPRMVANSVPSFDVLKSDRLFVREHEDETRLFDSWTTTQDECDDLLLLDPVLTSKRSMQGCHELTQQLTHSDISRHTENDKNYDQDWDTIGQALLTHEGLCMNPRSTHAAHDLKRDTHMFSRAAIEQRSATDSSTFLEHRKRTCSHSCNTDSTIFDDMDLQEGYVSTACSGRRSRLNPETAPAAKLSTEKSENTEWISDSMLFNSYDFTRTGFTPPAKADQSGSDQSYEVMFTLPTRSSTNTSPTIPSHCTKPRRQSLIFRRTRGSEASIMSDDEILLQQTSSQRDVQIKCRKATEPYA